jgi:hypothetical protein
MINGAGIERIAAPDVFCRTAVKWEVVVPKWWNGSSWWRDSAARGNENLEKGAGKGVS